MPRAFSVSLASRSLMVLGLAACTDDSTPTLTLYADVAAPATSNAQTPNLFTGPDGRVVMSWQEREGITARLNVSLRDTAGRWSAPRTIVQGTNLFVNWADFPSVVMLADGRLLAHWLERNGLGNSAYEIRLVESRDDGATWSAPRTPHRPGLAAEQGFVSILPTADSGARVFFLDGGEAVAAGGTGGHSHGGHASATALSVNEWSARTSASTKRVLDLRACDCCQTSAAMTANGPVLVYRDRSDDEIRDIAIVREVNGEWTTPVRVHADDWNIAACPVNGPSIVADGQFVAVAWFTGARDTAKVQLAFSTDAGATFGAPMRMDEGRPAGRVGVQLIGDAAVVSWLERTGGDTAQVMLRVVERDGTTNQRFSVGTSSGARSSGFPRLARVQRGTQDDVLIAYTVPGDTRTIKLALLSSRAAQP